MSKIEGIEEVIRLLEPHWDNIEEHFNTENEKFKALLAHDHDIIGRVLKCHLIVENYLDRYISDKYDMENLNEARLSFYQKAILLPSKESSAAFVKPGILRLNNIRNRFAHTLNFDIEIDDLGIINEILEVTRQGVQFENVIGRIEAFTIVACTWLIITPRELEHVFLDAFKEVRVAEL